MASSRSDISSLHASTTEIIARVATLGVALDEGFNMQTPTAGQGRPLEEFWAKQRSISDRHRDLNCTAAVLAQAKSGTQYALCVGHGGLGLQHAPWDSLGLPGTPGLSLCSLRAVTPRVSIWKIIY